MRIDKEDALHLSKVLAGVRVSTDTEAMLEHASAVELLRRRLDEFILFGDDADDDVEQCQHEFDGPVSLQSLIDLPKIYVIVGNASFGAPEERVTVEFDAGDDPDELGVARLLVGDGDNDPVVDGIAFVKRVGDEVTLYQTGVLDEGHASHTITIAPSTTDEHRATWLNTLPNGKVMAVRQ